MVPAGSLQYDPASGHASIAFFEFGDTLGNVAPDFCASGHALKVDLDRRLHVLLLNLAMSLMVQDGFTEITGTPSRHVLSSQTSLDAKASVRIEERKVAIERH
jgi:hypothetical protein